MRYAQMRKMDISNGAGVGVALFTQGCRIHCKNCFNKEIWDYEGGHEWTHNTMIAFLELMSPDYITRVSILGGEPLSKENLDDLKTLFTNIKQHYPKKEIWLYTGYIYENLKPKQKEVAQMADYVVDGPYIDEERDPKLQYRGSRNQRILKMNKNL